MNNNSERRLQAVKQHRLNIQRLLQHHIEVARAKRDEKLVRQLEAESNYYN
jgi:hypothetical protein